MNGGTEKKKVYHLRKIAKTATWRIIATLTTGGLVYLFTGQLALAAGVGGLEIVLKMLFYYLHEQAWDRISWGKPAHPLAQLPVRQELTPEDLEIIRQNLHDLGYL